MHQKIKEIITELTKNNPMWGLDMATLFFLKELGVTQTEAIISIHQGREVFL